MEKFPHHLNALFAQLGLASGDDDIAAFIMKHAPLPSHFSLLEAPFWTENQAAFLREELEEDADWAEVIDQLDVALRAMP
ncbi:DUF2789 domain-containing protein [Iodobacter sp. HSC-16F04]|uniref:DUF2789 domain-containing protein n=1 Tax=Iodobacter violaceini TaxID=3044271 RepID=A0ABX0L173_9NEIS|nr:DUF2789 domain-containing protein [Iodobacter violacea]NHQ88492.1 DUF2789 domain-containing protein [Iodobacter violacea]